MALDRPKLFVTGLAALYFGDVLIHPHRWRLLDSFNLLVHEAGHPLFSIFGEFMGFAGGTLMQLLVPVVFAVSFLRQGQAFSSALMLFWLGQSLNNVSIYAADAQAMDLPLFGAGDRIHDWNWMLSQTNLLWATPAIAGFFRLLSILAILAGLGACLAMSGVTLPSPRGTTPAPPRRRASGTFRRRGPSRGPRSHP